MSVQTVLAAGFLLLGGIALLSIGGLGEAGGWLALVFLILGTIPLLWCILCSFIRFWGSLFPSDPSTKSDKEELP